MDISRVTRAAVLLAMLFAAAPALAVPNGFNIQGRLVDANGVNRDGSYAMKFTLYDAGSGGNAI